MRRTHPERVKYISKGQKLFYFDHSKAHGDNTGLSPFAHPKPRLLTPIGLDKKDHRNENYF